MASPTLISMPAWVQLIQKHRGLLVPASFMLLLGVILVPLPPCFVRYETAGQDS